MRKLLIVAAVVVGLLTGCSSADDAECATVTVDAWEELKLAFEDLLSISRAVQDAADVSAIELLRDDVTDLIATAELRLTTVESLESDLETTDRLIAVWESVRDRAVGLASLTDAAVTASEATEDAILGSGDVAAMEEAATAMEEIAETIPILAARVEASLEMWLSTAESECHVAPRES